MNTIRNISIQVNSGRDFYLSLGDFLDDFYRETSRECRAAMLADAPDAMAGREYLAFLASAAHKLANDYTLEPPRWVFDKRCYLSGMEPFFGCRATGDLRLYFMYVSPSEFKHRNLFVDANVLGRV